jgi:hypothetical protein
MYGYVQMALPPAGLPAPLRELFVVQERERNILHQSFMKQAVSARVLLIFITAKNSGGGGNKILTVVESLA